MPLPINNRDAGSGADGPFGGGDPAPKTIVPGPSAKSWSEPEPVTSKVSEVILAPLVSSTPRNIGALVLLTDMEDAEPLMSTIDATNGWLYAQASIKAPNSETGVEKVRVNLSGVAGEVSSVPRRYWFVQPIVVPPPNQPVVELPCTYTRPDPESLKEIPIVLPPIVVAEVTPETTGVSSVPMLLQTTVSGVPVICVTFVSWVNVSACATSTRLARPHFPPSTTPREDLFLNELITRAGGEPAYFG